MLVSSLFAEDYIFLILLIFYAFSVLNLKKKLNSMK